MCPPPARRGYFDLLNLISLVIHFNVPGSVKCHLSFPLVRTSIKHGKPTNQNLINYNAFLCERLQRLFIIVNPFQFFIQFLLLDMHACVNDVG